MSLQIRRATVEDCERLVMLRVAMRQERETITLSIPAAVFHENTATFLRENLASGAFVCFVALHDTIIISMIGLVFYHVPPTYAIPNGKVAWLMSVYTVPEHRNKGIATSLLDAIVKHARDAGCQSIKLNASDMGKSIYERYGFIDIANEMKYSLL